MWKTALFLIFTLAIVPVVAFYYAEAPGMLQWKAIRTTVWIYLITASLCFVVSSIVQNYSQVDKLWSIMPIVYAWMIADIGGFEDRLVLMAVLVTLWGIRLTYNFWRRGGYSWKIWAGKEDYRWSILRAKPEFRPAWKWVLFNLFFISYYQMGIIMILVYPMIKAMGDGPLYWVDYTLAAIILLWIFVETIADQQQWNFQKAKQSLHKSGKNIPEDYRKGFLQNGLWAWVRHPNYTAEQAVWGTFYFFSVSATGSWVNWSITGALLLILLFQGSSEFSESISSSKYPDYSEYQKNVGRFLPFK